MAGLGLFGCVKTLVDFKNRKELETSSFLPNMSDTKWQENRWVTLNLLYLIMELSLLTFIWKKRQKANALEVQDHPQQSKRSVFDQNWASRFYWKPLKSWLSWYRCQDLQLTVSTRKRNNPFAGRNTSLEISATSVVLKHLFKNKLFSLRAAMYIVSLRTTVGDNPL